MKAKHRHELKTNELAEWLSNFPQWAKKNFKTIIYVSIVAVLVIGSYFWHKYQKNVVAAQKELKFTTLITQPPRNKIQILQAQAQGRDYSFLLLQMADDLQTTAQETKNNQAAALALIKRAESLRAELHYRSGTAGKQETAAQMEKARASYREVLEKCPTNRTLVAIAKFGLGLCEEEVGNFEDAAQIYREIIANADFEGTTAAAQAKHRLDTMADYQQEVVFKRVSEQVPTELIEPQIKLKIPEVPGPQTQNDALEVPNTIKASE